MNPLIFGMSQHVDQNLLLKIMEKLYTHKIIIAHFKVLELKWCLKIKVFLNGTSLLKNLITFGLEYVHQISAGQPTGWVLSSLGSFWNSGESINYCPSLFSDSAKIT